MGIKPQNIKEVESKASNIMKQLYYYRVAQDKLMKSRKSNLINGWKQ